MKIFRRNEQESGATAVMVALMATMLIVLAGLAVDLGNTWSRVRLSQKQADIAALSAANLLPMSTTASLGNTAATIAEDVRKNLNSNPTYGAATVATAATLLDGNVPNGEVRFYSNEAAARTNGAQCTGVGTTVCTIMKVFPPQAHVDFSFTAALSDKGSTNVARAAIVKITSGLPPPKKILPFWLPSGCGYGAAQADVSGGPSPGPQAPVAGLLPNTVADRTAKAAALVAQAAQVLDYAPPGLDTSVTISATGNPYTVSSSSQTISLTTWTVGAPKSGYSDNGSIVVFDSSGNNVVSYATARPNNNATSWNPTSGSITMSDLGNKNGTYTAYYKVTKGNGTNATVVYSNAFVTLTVTNAPTPSATPTTATPTVTPTVTPTTATATPTSTPTTSTPSATSSTDVGCLGNDRGNFGQLNSPRGGSLGDRNGRLASNIAVGLDHQITPFVWGSSQTPTKDCGKKTTPITNAVQDTDAYAPTYFKARNCIQGDTGNDGASVYDGLVQGPGGGVKGRLDAANGATSCGGARSNQTYVKSGTYTLNNDTLSCYLRNGATLSSIAQSTGVNDSMLDPSILKSPRFVYLPVVYATDRAQKDFQPVQSFVTAFITDEATTSTSSPGSFSSPHGINGLELNASGQQVKILHVFVFNKKAVVGSEADPDAPYDPALDNKEIRLIG